MQQVAVRHRTDLDMNAPVIVCVSGYGIWDTCGTQFLRWARKKAHIVMIEQRGYGGAHLTSSAVESPDLYRRGKVAQDALDVVTFLQRVYPGSWVSYGRSKGGTEGLALRYHAATQGLHPIKASVAVAAPVFLSSDDFRGRLVRPAITGERLRQCAESADALSAFLMDIAHREEHVKGVLETLDNDPAFTGWEDHPDIPSGRSREEVAESLLLTVPFGHLEILFTYTPYSDEACARIAEALEAKTFEAAWRLLWDPFATAWRDAALSVPFTCDTLAVQYALDFGHLSWGSDAAREAVKQRVYTNPADDVVCFEGRFDPSFNQSMTDWLSSTASPPHNVVSVFGNLDVYHIARPLLSSRGAEVGHLNVVVEGGHHFFDFGDIDDAMRDTVANMWDEWTMGGDAVQ